MTRRFQRWSKLLYAAPLLWLTTTLSARADFGGAVSPSAHELFNVGGFPITNSMVTTWFFTVLIVVVMRVVAGRPKLIPSRGQAIIESMIEGVRNVVAPILGEKMVKPAFPLLIGLFTYILLMNWSALLPGAGTFGMVKEGTVPAAAVQEYVNEDYTATLQPDGNYFVHKLDYFFRPSNADLNTTLALAAVAWLAWLYFVLRYAGFKMLIHDLFGNKASRSEVSSLMYFILTVIFLGVGLIEVVSIIFRLVSLSFRLFGNVFGGENLISRMHGLVAFAVPVPFYFLEVLIGLIQAFVFTLLVAVYIGLICNHEGGGDHGRDKEHAAH